MSDDHGDEIKVKDRRTFTEEADADEPAGAGRATEAEREATRDAYAEAAGECVEPDQDRPLPPVDFSTLVLSIAQGALMNLGELEDPETGEKSENFALARHNIDLLSLLQDKTRGNLDHDEQKLIENLLYDLRMKYVSQCRGG